VAGLRGDFAALRTMVRALARLGAAGTSERLSKQLAHEGLALVKKTFREESDPYGERWAPLTRRKGKILRDTGRLANSWGVRAVTRAGFTVATTTQYASIHQRGAKYRAKARFAAVDARGRYMKHSAARRRRRGSIAVRYHAARDVVIPARRMIPDATRGMPSAWADAFKETAQAFVSRLMKRRKG